MKDNIFRVSIFVSVKKWWGGKEQETIVGKIKWNFTACHSYHFCNSLWSVRTPRLWLRQRNWREINCHEHDSLYDKSPLFRKIRWQTEKHDRCLSYGSFLMRSRYLHFFFVSCLISSAPVDIPCLWPFFCIPNGSLFSSISRHLTKSRRARYFWYKYLILFLSFLWWKWWW